MLSRVNELIEKKIHSYVRKSLLDWPLDFGVETAVMNGVVGDYHEFGVYKGRSFTRNVRRFLDLLPPEEAKKMRFWAYDSFEGLPETQDAYAPAHFSKGSFAAPEELFRENVKAAGIGEQAVRVVKGFYDVSLNDEAAKQAFGERKVAMAYIDCDIYESAVPIFDFLAKGLQVGSVLVIDDWVRHHVHPRHGIQRAFNEWIDRNPRFKATQIALTKRVAFVFYEV